MPLFSERFGYKEVRNALQYECMSDELRMSIYNVIFQWLNDYCTDRRSLTICRNLWSNFWHLPLDTFPEPDPIASFYTLGDRKYEPAFLKRRSNI
jgi:hypothetical protein